MAPVGPGAVGSHWQQGRKPHTLGCPEEAAPAFCLPTQPPVPLVAPSNERPIHPPNTELGHTPPALGGSAAADGFISVTSAPCAQQHGLNVPRTRGPPTIPPPFPGTAHAWLRCEHPRRAAQEGPTACPSAVGEPGSFIRAAVLSSWLSYCSTLDRDQMRLTN